jgi:YggT family protein
MDFLITFVDLLFYLLNLAIFIRIMMSWLPMAGVHVDPYNPAVRVLHEITDPILEPFRRIVPPLGMVDISPIVAVLVLRVVQSIVMSILTSV